RGPNSASRVVNGLPKGTSERRIYADWTGLPRPVRPKRFFLFTLVNGIPLTVLANINAKTNEQPSKRRPAAARTRSIRELLPAIAAQAKRLLSSASSCLARR